jgi:hypothetical protein
MNTTMPPQWVDLVLRVILPLQDCQTVSGDLLEEYRERIYPARGKYRADFWYVGQVSGFAWRANRTWAGLLGGAVVTRTALDWLVPTADFNARSTVSTIVSAGIFVFAGFWAARRSSSLRAGTIAGVLTALIAAVISILGAGLLLAIRHNPATLAVIEGSGGLREVFTLPLLLIVPGALLSTLGGLVCRLSQFLLQRRSIAAG